MLHKASVLSYIPSSSHFLWDQLPWRKPKCPVEEPHEESLSVGELRPPVGGPIGG